jgi:hypothetical protein
MIGPARRGPERTRVLERDLEALDIEEKTPRPGEDAFELTARGLLSRMKPDVEKAQHIIDPPRERTGANGEHAGNGEDRPRPEIRRTFAGPLPLKAVELEPETAGATVERHVLRTNEAILNGRRKDAKAFDIVRKEPETARFRHAPSPSRRDAAPARDPPSALADWL